MDLTSGKMLMCDKRMYLHLLLRYGNAFYDGTVTQGLRLTATFVAHLVHGRDGVNLCQRRWVSRIELMVCDEGRVNLCWKISG